jgi:hypothetical protein
MWQDGKRGNARFAAASTAFIFILGFLSVVVFLSVRSVELRGRPPKKGNYSALLPRNFFNAKKHLTSPMDRRQVERTIAMVESAKAHGRVQRAEYGRYTALKQDLSKASRASQAAAVTAAARRNASHTNRHAVSSVSPARGGAGRVGAGSYGGAARARSGKATAGSTKRAATSGPTGGGASATGAAEGASSSPVFAELDRLLIALHRPPRGGGLSGTHAPRPLPPPLPKLAPRADATDADVTSAAAADTVRDLLCDFRPDQRRILEAVEVGRRRTERRAAQVASMYEHARRRRLVASQRLQQDPPADMLVAPDPRRYVPADVLAAMPAAGGTAGGSYHSTQHGGLDDDVFLTAVDATVNVEKPHTATAGSGGGAEADGRRGTVGTSSTRGASTLDRSRAAASMRAVIKGRAGAGPPQTAPAGATRPPDAATRLLRALRFAAATGTPVVLPPLEAGTAEAVAAAATRRTSEWRAASASATSGLLPPLTATRATSQRLTAAQTRAAMDWHAAQQRTLFERGHGRGLAHRATTWVAKAQRNDPPLPLPSRSLDYLKERPRGALRDSLYV